MLPFALLISLITSCIELEISSPAFPLMASFFQVSEGEISRTITTNLIGFFLGALFWGPLSERWGRRKIMLIGNALLALSAMACVFASSLPLLLFIRFFQGCGAATSAVVTSIIIDDVFNTQRAARLYGVMNAVFSTLMALAPLIGAWLTEWGGWRMPYTATALITVFSWIILFFFLPETSSQKRPLTLHSLVKEYGTLLKSFRFLSLSLTPSLLYGGYLSFITFAAFLYQENFHLSYALSAYHQATILAAFALTSLSTSRITAFLGETNVLRISSLLQLIGSFSLCLSQTPFTTTLSMSLFCMGFALFYPITFARSLEVFPHLKGSASSLIMALRYLVCSTLVGSAGLLYDGTSFSLGLLMVGMSSCVFVLSLRIFLRE